MVAIISFILMCWLIGAIFEGVANMGKAFASTMQPVPAKALVAQKNSEQLQRAIEGHKRWKESQSNKIEDHLARHLQP